MFTWLPAATNSGYVGTSSGDSDNSAARRQRPLPSVIGNGHRRAVSRDAAEGFVLKQADCWENKPVVCYSVMEFKENNDN